MKALSERAAEFYERGTYEEAIKVAQQALALAERMLGPDHPDTLSGVNDLGVFYQAQGRMGEAEPLLKRAVAGREKALGPEDPATLMSIDFLGSLYLALGRYGEAEPLLKRAVATCEKTLEQDHPVMILSVNNLGVLYLKEGRYGEAEPLLKRGLAGYEQGLGPDHPATLRSVNNLAVLYQGQGRYIEAEPLLKRALAGYEKALGPEHPSTLLSVSNLGILNHTLGRDSEAEPLYKRALAGYEKALGREHPETLKSVNDLGSLFSAQGRYGEAEQLFRRALAGHEHVFGPEHPSTLMSLSNLGLFYQAQDRYGESEPLLKRALAGYEKTLGSEHRDTVTSANNLGLLYSGQGRYFEAEPLLKRAVEGHRKALGPEHQNTLRSINNLGLLYADQGRYSEAEALYLQSLSGREKTLGAEHPDTLTSLGNLGTLHFQQSDWRGASHWWRRSTAAIAKRVQRGAVDLGLKGKQRSEAEQLGWHFWGLVKVGYRLAQGSDKQDAVLFGESFQTAQWALSSQAAQSLAQMAVRGAKGDPALATVLRERQDLLDEWQRRESFQTAALGQGTATREALAEADNRQRMAAIDQRIAEIDRRLNDAFPDYAALASPGPLAVEEAQALLGTDEALMLLLDTPEAKPTPAETFIWVLTKTDVRWVRSSLGGTALTREVQALRCGVDQEEWSSLSNARRCAELLGLTEQQDLSRPLPFALARAHDLYKALFGEIESLIKGKHLLIVPSGSLTQLPLQVLVVAPPNGDYRSTEWLIRDHAITILPAVSSLKALRATSRPSAASKPLIGFGNPLLDGPDTRYSKSAKLSREKQSCPRNLWQRVAARFELRNSVTPIETRAGIANVSLIRALSPLPETADELCAVARDIGIDASEIRLGAKATEREVKAMSARGELAQYRVVHFATHGAMAGEFSKGAEPGLILTPPDAPSDEDDGYLSASEIAALKLDADWVILSACNTAAGNNSSAEALSGLARAFIYAQARALLVSHWAVDSNATVKLITWAMREIARDKTVGRAEALRRAMLGLIDRGEAYEAHPAYWAPFIVVGEGAR